MYFYLEAIEISKVSFLSFAITIILSVSGTSIADAQVHDPIVLLNTTKGPIVIRVYRYIVPYTSQNFLDLVSRGFYNGLSFHRVESWCVQGGDPNGNGTGDFIDPETGRARYINLEASPKLRHNQPGVVAMARGTDYNSASCQFYITKSAVPQLDGKYAIFGGVVDGMNSVYNITVGDRILSARIVEHAPDVQIRHKQMNLLTKRRIDRSANHKRAAFSRGHDLVSQCH